MIKKWRNRIILYGLIFIALYVIGILIFISIDNMNKEFAALGRQENLVEAEIVRIPNSTYNDSGEFAWGYMLPDSCLPDGYERGKTEDGKTLPDGVLWRSLSVAEVEELNNKTEVYSMIKDGRLITWDKTYVDDYKPGGFGSSIFLWALGAIFLAITIVYVVKHITMINTLRKGELSIGRFEEAFHSKMGSHKFYQVRFSYIRDGEQAEAVTEAFYTGKEVDSLKNYGSFEVRYLNKNVFINQKL